MGRQRKEEKRSVQRVERRPAKSGQVWQEGSKLECPRCAGSLDERDRGGIVVDVCRACRGIWLDAGELEKLLDRAAKETSAVGLRGAASAQPRWFELLRDSFD